VVGLATSGWLLPVSILRQSSSVVVVDPAHSHSVLEVKAEDEGEDGEDGEVSHHRTGWLFPVVHFIVRVCVCFE